MARRNDHSREELRSMMLDSAIRIAGTEGFEALTARRLARDVGYAVGTIYNVFKTMDDLYLEVNGHTLDALYGLMEKTVAENKSKPPADQMKALAASYIKFTRDEAPYWRMLFGQRLPPGHDLPEWYAGKVEKLFEPLAGTLAALYGPQDKERIRKATKVLWASVHGMCVLQDTGKVDLTLDGEDIQELADFLVDNFTAQHQSAQMSLF